MNPGRVRIAVSSWFWDRPDTGSGQYVRQLVPALAAAHAEAEWLLLVPQGTPASGIASAPNVAWVELPVRRGRLGKLLWEQLTVPGVARRLRANLLHVPYWAPPLRATPAVVVTVLDLIPLLLPEYRGSLPVRAYTQLVVRAARRASLVLTDSESARRDILEHLRVANEAVSLTYLAADARYAPAPSSVDEQVRSRFGIEPGYVLYLGGFDARKNLGALARAFARVSQSLPATRLAVAGRLPARDSTFAPDPRRLMHEAGAREEAIAWLGYVAEDDKALLYQGARLFVYPSRYEGFGLPPLEAMACGVPVVASDAASLPEVVGKGGLLVDPEDVEGMASAMCRVLSDGALHLRLSAQATAEAKRFSWERTAAATWDAFEKALEWHGGRHPG